MQSVPAGGSLAIGSDNIITSQDYIEVEHVKARLLTSSFAKDPTVLIHAAFSFAPHYYVLMFWVIVGPFKTPLLAVADFNWGEEASRYCEF